ncbi:MAG: hypothetical protein JSS72_09355 [Armatimonadetes bacterium]|nr:hypothetical protein [Armatimonadota bacterium]
MSIPKSKKDWREFAAGLAIILAWLLSCQEVLNLLIRLGVSPDWAPSVYSFIPVLPLVIISGRGILNSVPLYGYAKEFVHPALHEHTSAFIIALFGYCLCFTSEVSIRSLNRKTEPNRAALPENTP